MKRKSFSRRTWILLGVLVVALAAAVGGYAFFSTTGTGSGTAAVGNSTAGSITVVGTADGKLLPGGTVPVSFTATNAASYSQKLNGIHLESVSVEGSPADCDPADFTMATDVVVGSDGTIAGSTGPVAITEQGTLAMADTAVSQDGCQGATLDLTFTTS